MTNFDGQSASWQIPERVHVEPSQLLVAISLDPERREALDVCILDRGHPFTPDRVRFVGAGLLTLPEHGDDPVEALDALPAAKAFHEARASRTRGALGGELHDRLGRAELLVVGAGGGGSELARQLAAVGPRRLVVLDPDAVGAENLFAMPHAAQADAERGAAKVDVLLRTIHANQPDLWLGGLARSITHAEGAALVAQNRFDTVFSFVDDNPARLATGWLCRTGHMVHLDVGTLIRFDEAGERVMRADVRLFEPRRGCVACVPPMPELDDALYELSAPPGAMHRGRPRAWHEDRAGSLLLLNSLAASLTVDLWLAYLAGRIETSHWIRVRWTFGETPVTEAANVTAGEGCRFCEE
jgi:molybdopterin/thiamine biosynthesis adenylyltransferase